MDNNKKIIVHICCAACFSYVYKILKQENFDIYGLFYNPCVHGRTEYNNRLRDVEKFCKMHDINLAIPEYDIQDFFGPIEPLQDKNSIKYIADKQRWRNRRCFFCYDLLLSSAAKLAKKKGIGYFTSSMLATPYKDHDEIEKTGLVLGRENGVEFYYTDFRKGYWNGRNYARSHHLLIPTYCGCSYSVEEGLLE